MGAYAPGNDATLDEAIAARDAMTGFLSQGAKARVDFATARQALVEGFGA
jgi:flagellum-specific ATP synthase